ncbi:LysM peptidoglycan-binding domain-containing protein [Peribacillus butanolivorans]|nr:LysM peptidoglycan-binding domain-containing protein [Peribacillus butanolivorans]
MKGDTCYSIAIRYGTTVDNLKSLNPKKWILVLFKLATSLL